MTEALRRSLVERFPEAARRSRRLDPERDIDDPAASEDEAYHALAEHLRRLVSRTACDGRVSQSSRVLREHQDGCVSVLIEHPPIHLSRSRTLLERMTPFRYRQSRSRQGSRVPGQLVKRNA